MLEREDIEDIFEMYFMGMTPDEINQKFQEYGIGIRDNKPFQEYQIPEMDVVQILKNYAVVGKKIITQEHKINGKLVLESIKSIAKFSPAYL